MDDHLFRQQRTRTLNQYMRKYAIHNITHNVVGKYIPSSWVRYPNSMSFRIAINNVRTRPSKKNITRTYPEKSLPHVLART